MEGESRVWIFMALALVVLAVNLLYPRSRGLKICALLFLFLALCLHSSFQLNHIERSFNALERYGRPHDDAPTESGFPWIRPLRSAVDAAFFDMWLGLSLGVLFALLPADSLSRAYARIRRRAPAAASGQIYSAFDRAAVSAAVISVFAFIAAQAWLCISLLVDGVSQPIGLSFPLLLGALVTAPVSVLALVISLLVYVVRDSRSRAATASKA
jgi:hypothetical protein